MILSWKLKQVVNDQSYLQSMALCRNFIDRTVSVQYLSRKIKGDLALKAGIETGIARDLLYGIHVFPGICNLGLGLASSKY